MKQPATPYRGRFAPTPSGPLHMGSLVAAMGSYLDAMAANGTWLVRMEDVDPPRVVPGAADTLLKTLECYGFEWSGPVLAQSTRGLAYQQALDALSEARLIYGCGCSRKRIADTAVMGVEGPVYPGFCRGHPLGAGLAWRFAVPNRRVVFTDGLLGRVACDVAKECGDFVLKRADGVFTYQLAVVVDDQAQGITHVVRGADLLPSTPRQILLQQALGYATPAYAHLPVVLDARGDKLSKQTRAMPLDLRAPLPALLAAGRFLGMPLEPAANVVEFWDQARECWPGRRVQALRGQRRGPEGG